MQFSHSPATLQTWTGSVLAVGLCEGDGQGLVSQLESRLGLSIQPWLETRRFSGKAGDIATLPVLKEGLTTLVLVGLGSEDAVGLPQPAPPKPPWARARALP